MTIFFIFLGVDMNGEPPTTQDLIDAANCRCYDVRGSIWDRFPFPDVIPQYMERYYKSSLGQRVLDVGSGTGVLANWLANQGYSVLCIDPSLEMVQRCSKKGLQALQAKVQDFTTEEQFGTIFAILSLIHVPKKDFDGQLQKLHTILMPNGLFFLAMLEGHEEKWIDKESEFPRFISFYTKEEILKHTQGMFVLRDTYYTNTYGTGYFLFVFSKM